MTTDTLEELGETATAIEESTIAFSRSSRGTTCELRVSAIGSASHHARWALTDELAALLDDSEQVGRSIAYRLIETILAHPESSFLRGEIRKLLDDPKYSPPDAPADLPPMAA